MPEIAKTLGSFEHPFEIDYSEPKKIELYVGYGQPVSIVGRQDPVKITLYDQQDILIFEMKYFGKVYMASQTKIYEFEETYEAKA